MLKGIIKFRGKLIAVEIHDSLKDRAAIRGAQEWLQDSVAGDFKTAFEAFMEENATKIADKEKRRSAAIKAGIEAVEKEAAATITRIADGSFASRERGVRMQSDEGEAVDALIDAMRQHAPTDVPEARKRIAAMRKEGVEGVKIVHAIASMRLMQEGTDPETNAEALAERVAAAMKIGKERAEEKRKAAERAKARATKGGL